jgi:DNA invertase Pin-like site-specific DNA recombinase
MSKMTRYGYARVSGTSQDLTEQIARLQDAGCTEILSEKHTGTKKERPEFQRVLSLLQAGDTLVVTKLDRFARSAEDGIRLIKELIRRGVSVHILNMGIVEDTPTGRLLLTILSGFAEFERDMIVERLAEGKAAAKQREGYQEGRPNKYTKAQMAHAMTLLESHSYTEVERLTGISKATLTRHKRKLISK